MSYFIANTITISKDRKTFKAKGGDNNVIPRSNEWTRDIDIRNLLDCLSSGNIQTRAQKDLFLLLEQLVQKYKKSYGGTWEDNTDFYHEHMVANMTIEKLKENLEYVKNSTSYAKSYQDKEVKHLTYAIENHKAIQDKVNNHIDSFLKELFDTLDNLKTNTDMYILGNGYSYIRELLRARAYTTDRKEHALKMNLIQAQRCFERFEHGGYKIIKIEN